MIPRTTRTWQTPTWQTELAQAIRDPAELLALLELSPAQLSAGAAAAQQFPLLVTRSYAARMGKGNPQDPLLLQVLPLGKELEDAPGFVADPVGDLRTVNAPGVLHKYQGRALLITTGACAIHCRYCFRRHFPYPQAHAAIGGWRPALDYLRSTPSVSEAILSGGDPLVLSDHKLAGLVEELDGIPHIKRLRIHSRLPIVLPSRVDPALLHWLGQTRLQLVLVIHANHPNELSEDVAWALGQLRDRGVTLLNQAVLLRGINDELSCLVNLSERLFEVGVLPYYLHLLDRVQGAAHFEVDEPTARWLHDQVRSHLPGYLVPRLVREVEGDPAKRPLPPFRGNNQPFGSFSE